MATVGLLHPGEMGPAVGGCLVSVGHEVLWHPAGRSRATTGRALAAGLTGVSFDRLAAKSSVILSICPPHAALDVARQVAAAGYTGLYVDANAISVATAGQVEPSSRPPARPTSTGGSSGRPPRSLGTRASTCPARTLIRSARSSTVRRWMRGSLRAPCTRPHR